MLIPQQLFLFIAQFSLVHSFLPQATTPDRSCALLMGKARRGRLGKEVGLSNSGSRSGGKRGDSMGNRNSGGGVDPWIPLLIKSKDLPQEEGVVKMIDTELKSFKNSATNPTGAISFLRQPGGKLYCFEASCPSCKIPMSKSKVLPPNDETSSPRLSCGFCKATYDIQTGKRLSSAESGGIFGGVVKSVFAAKETGSLQTYKLGEKNGKLLLALN